jgi:hypothetical protein
MTDDNTPILRVARALPRGVLVSQSPLSNTTVASWQTAIARMLEPAFLNRPACFLTPEDNASTWDLDLCQMVPDCETHAIGGYRYVCAFDRSASAATLSAVAASQDLYLGPVWIAALTRADRDRLFALVGAMLNAGPSGWPQTREEIVYTNPDGDYVHWLNPSIPEPSILEALGRLARANGWRMETDFTAGEEPRR